MVVYVYLMLILVLGNAYYAQLVTQKQVPDYLATDELNLVAQEGEESPISFSINSPRKKSDVLVKLPSDRRKHLEPGIREINTDTPNTHYERNGNNLNDTFSFINNDFNYEDEKVWSPPPLPPIVKVVSKSGWEIAWECHLYFSSTLYLLLALCCLFKLIRSGGIFPRGYHITLYLCILLISCARPIYLLVDPYNKTQFWSRMVNYLMQDIGLPCLSSGFAIIFLALLRSTQLELISPTFQTPLALGCLCLFHFGLTIGLDIVIGYFYYLRYLVLVIQGFFIVWSLLLSFGYFYIFTAMNAIVRRSIVAISHQYYSKSMPPLGQAVEYGGQNAASHYSQNFDPDFGLAGEVGRMRSMSRAVRLTLGVAVLGSLMGGLNLFAMIKILGIIKQDLKQEQNVHSWFGYQVSMRVLEVIICTLLVIIATTPGSDRSSSSISYCQLKRRFAKNLCCWKSREEGLDFDWRCPANTMNEDFTGDEIYSEICCNHSDKATRVDAANREVMMMDFSGDGTEAVDGTFMLDNLNSPLGPNSTISSHPLASQTMQSATLSRISTSTGLVASGASVASSRATIDTNLAAQTCLNLRSDGNSRPSSMLYNGSGFFRFKMGAADNPWSVDTKDSVQMSPHTSKISVQKMSEKVNHHRDERRKKNLLIASHSFDDTILQSEELIQDINLKGNQIADTDKNCKARKDTVSYLRSPIYKSIDSLHTDEDGELSDLYRAPPGMKFDENGDSAAAGKCNVVSLGCLGYSESDLSSIDPLYAAGGSAGYGAVTGHHIARSLAPSRCSSISATQSFDMRMYGRSRPNPNAPNSSTLNWNKHKDDQRLENPYYYYGSTRNQKHVTSVKQKPRPPLPSQRQMLLTSELSNPSSNSRPNSRQALLPAVRSCADPPQPAIFQRSRSLGHHYGPQPRQQYNQPKRALRGSKLQAKKLTTKHLTQCEIRGIFGTPPVAPRRQGARWENENDILDVPTSHTEVQSLSPIFTDQETSPSHKREFRHVSDEDGKKEVCETETSLESDVDTDHHEKSANRTRSDLDKHHKKIKRRKKSSASIDMFATREQTQLFGLKSNAATAKSHNIQNGVSRSPEWEENAPTNGARPFRRRQLVELPKATKSYVQKTSLHNHAHKGSTSSNDVKLIQGNKRVGVSHSSSDDEPQHRLISATDEQRKAVTPFKYGFESTGVKNTTRLPLLSTKATSTTHNYVDEYLDGNLSSGASRTESDSEEGDLSELDHPLHSPPLLPVHKNKCTNNI